ncbi:MAG: hypothetical protein WDO70_00030 [Alphaproteobacteria bacterium]
MSELIPANIDDRVYESDVFWTFRTEGKGATGRAIFSTKPAISEEYVVPATGDKAERVSYAALKAPSEPQRTVELTVPELATRIQTIEKGGGVANMSRSAYRRLVGQEYKPN